MDFGELRHSTKKAKRVRSWYLYEQYKSLEKNQIHGAQALKDRSCQEKILHQELEERRVRRQICDQSGISQSECRLPKGINSDAGTLASASTDDFIDNFCDFQESEATVVNLDQTYSLTLNSSDYDDKNENGAIITYSEESTTNTAEKDIDTNSDVQTELEMVKQNIEETIQLQLETMKENIQCLERYGKQSITDKMAEELSVNSVKQYKVCNSAEYDNSLHAIWARLVSFAYQVLRLNRGNCYYDYSSQFMAAVLVCDILCKGINRMCDILQPYVSPVKFASDESVSSIDSKTKVNNNRSFKGFRRLIKSKLKRSKLHNNRSQCKKKVQTKWRHSAKDPIESLRRSKARNLMCECDLLNSMSTLKPLLPNISISDSWVEEYSQKNHLCNDCCSCPHKVDNPMIKLSRYMDSVLKDLDD